MNGNWKRLINTKIDDLEQTLLLDISKISSDDTLLICIATDSGTVRKGRLQYATAIAILNKGKGGWGYYKTNYEKFTGSHKYKLMLEVQKSIETAIWLQPILEKIGLSIDRIEADVNADETSFSNSMMSQVLGYIRACGFEAVCKPEAFVPNIIAHNTLH